MLLQASWTDPLHLTSPPWSTTPRQHVDWPRYHCRILLPISTTAGWFPAGLVGEAQMGLVQIGMHEKKRRREERIRTLKKQIRERTEKETGKGARERKYSKKYKFIKRVTLSRCSALIQALVYLVIPSTTNRVIFFSKFSFSFLFVMLIHPGLSRRLIADFRRKRRLRSVRLAVRKRLPTTLPPRCQLH